MITTPSMVRVDLSPDDARAAIEHLERFWQLPDGSEVVSHHELRRCRSHLERNRCFYRLVWPEGTTREQALAWWDHAQQIIRWHKERKL